MPQFPTPLWNDTAKAYPRDARITDLLKDQVNKTPDAIALEDHGKHYTYSELDAATEKLAWYLHDHGLQDGEIVGCYLSRSSSIITTILGTLKAGGAYLLLDPSLPQRRLHYMIDDAQPSIIISDIHTRLLDSHNELPVVYLSDITENNDHARADEFLDHRPGIPHAAYMAYTSGSTGRPKGVVITHSSTINHSLAFDDLFAMTARDRVAMLAPIAFDVATEEILPALMAGATVVVAASQYNSMEEFTDEIERENITIVNIPAPMWHSWTDYLHDENRAIPDCLRLVIVGSDKTYVDTYMKWRSLEGAESVHWVCAYGITETTVTSTFYVSAAEDDLSDEPYVPIGTPIANTYTYILDDDGKPVPVGETGELYIGGAGVAAGYHHSQGDSDKRFMHDPFSDDPDARVYRTGDLAHYRPDGVIVWLGRKDLQVKVNGLRVELGEIEAVLKEHPKVRDAVVVAPQARSADAQLTAFLTLYEPDSDASQHVKEFLASHVHRHMVPSTFRIWQEMPINANGKIDRIALENYAASMSQVRV